MTDEWIEWAGGENPVPGHSVEVRYRYGEVDSVVASSERFRWGHPWITGGDNDLDIIPYRVVPLSRGSN